ncbi:MAG: PIN domain-containing protein [Chloroflexi bacterium]|nr:PIN domain-containing protein [Chloroflexota bacterium]
MYLLDTDILVNVLGPVPSKALAAKLALVPVEQQLTSSITLAELLYEAYRRQERTAATLEQVERRVISALPILPFDAEAARRYGEIRATLERQGMRLADADLRIAAIALAQGLTVVTGNVRHFQRVPGLAVENWLEGQTP